MNQALEESLVLSLDFKKMEKIVVSGQWVVPVVVQEDTTKDVLILGYMNEQALKQTFLTKKVTFWSTSRKQLWVKGETSGNTLNVKDVRVNCEQNSLLVLACLNGAGACHAKNQHGAPHISCYYRAINADSTLSII